MTGRMAFWRRKREVPPPGPDALASAAEGMAKLLDAITSAKIREIEATAADREREFEQRQKDREAAREARRKAIENRRGAGGRFRARQVQNADCPFCANPYHYPFTLEERDRHMSHGGVFGSVDGMQHNQS